MILPLPNSVGTPAVVLAQTTLPSLWSEPWSWEPAITIPLAFLVAVYVVGAVRRGNPTALRWRHTSFAFGWTTLALALTSPIHELGEQLFSAHMVQHEILILISAPLISAAHPAATCLWAFSPRSRQNLGGWVHSVEQTPWLNFLTRPLVAWILEAFTLWIWHEPALYQATLTSDVIHAAQHLSFFLTAVLFWSALYGVSQSAVGYGAATLYVFGTAVHCSALGALLTFSTVLWYPAYARTAARWGLTALQDQQLGGVIMWVPSGVIFIFIGLALFAKWIAESDRRMKLGTLHTAIQLQQIHETREMEKVLEVQERGRR
jgi:putative membrane protein